jgi:hypothetical protein
MTLVNRTGRPHAAAAALLASSLAVAPVAAETAHGRVTFVGTLSEEAQANGAVAARFRFRLSESYCSTTVDGLWMKSWDGTSWSSWQRVSPVTLASDPAAISRGPGLLDVFATGMDGRMYQMSWDGTRWSDWLVVDRPFPLGPALGTPTFTSGPAVASTSANRMDLFARGPDGTLWTNMWAGRWAGWRPIAPQVIEGDPAVVSPAPGRMDVFARQPDNTIYTMTSTDGTTWSVWSSMGGETFSSGPAATSSGPGRVDLFARGMDNRLYTRTLTTTSSTAWAPVLPEATVSDPAAVSVASSSVELFARRADNQIYSASTANGSVQRPWTALGTEAFTGGPAAASRGINRVDVFARGGGRSDRWFHVKSGRTDGPFSANFRNAYSTLVSGFLARTVTSVQLDGIPDCGEAQVQTLSVDRIQIGLHP